MLRSFQDILLILVKKFTRCSNREKIRWLQKRFRSLLNYLKNIFERITIYTRTYLQFNVGTLKSKNVIGYKSSEYSTTYPYNDFHIRKWSSLLSKKLWQIFASLCSCWRSLWTFLGFPPRLVSFKIQLCFASKNPPVCILSFI